MRTFEVPASSGSTSASGLFPRFRGAIHVDRPVVAFLEEEPSFALQESLVCNLDEGSEETKFSELVGDQRNLSVVEVCGILSYFGGEGWRLLAIPEGREEVNILIGWIQIGKSRRVLYIEHEKEPGKDEEIHLHAASPGEKENQEVLVLFPVLL